MFSGKNQASQRPTAFGSMLQASTYGMAIPEIYGRVQSPLLAIWAQNLRQGGSTKKFKQMKKGITAYCENIDFLLGKNPLLGVLQMWNNGAKLPLTFTSYQTTVTAPGPASVTVPDAHFYAVIGVTLTQNYSQAVNDYGGPGPSTLSGSYEVPLWNQAFAGSDPTDSHDYRNFPFVYRWIPSDGATVYFDQWPYGPMGSGTLTIYYAQLMAATKYQPPSARLRLSFESELGSGDEYAGYSAQQILYPWYAGLGSPDIDLGAAGAIPAMKAEVQGKWGVYPSGDCDFVDIIEDICKSGISQAALGGTLNFGTAQHGLGAWDYPGTIQKKMATGDAVGLPVIAYDLPNTPGNILVAIASSGSSLAISDSSGSSWTAVMPTGMGVQMWYAAAAGGANTVTISGAGANATAMIMEIGGAGTVETTSATFLGVVNNASGAMTKNVSSSLGPFQAAAVWSNFLLVEPLPPDAVIQGIYPVIVAQASAPNSVSTISWGTGLTADPNQPGPGGLNFNNPAGRGNSFPGTECWSNSIGTALSALSGQQIAASLAASINAYWGSPADSLDVSAVGFAVYYTSGTAPSGTPPIAAPFTPPAGQYVAWALPASCVASGSQSFAPFLDPSQVGSQTGSGGAAGWTYSSSSTTVVSGSTGSWTVEAAGASAGAGSIDSTTAAGTPAFLLAVPFYSSTAPAGAAVAKWNALTPENFYSNSPAPFQAHGRVVRYPGSFAYAGPGSPMTLGMLSIKASQPPSYPNPLGSFIDPDTRELTRAQCRAGGLWGSLSMNAQQKAQSWIEQLVTAADCAPVFSGFRLKLVPRSEVSAAGNGAVYIAPTASGPVADLDVDNGDFVAEAGQPAITVVRKARIDTDTVLQMQHLNRSSDYAQVVTAVPDPAGIALYGVRKKDPEVNNAIQDVSVARSILGIEVRRRNYVEVLSYTFKLNARWGLLEAMDLVTITDRSQGIVSVPVRLTSVEEAETYELGCEAEPYCYGVHAPQAVTATPPSPYSGSGAVNTSAGNVNAPIIFEPVPRLYGNAAQAQLWLAISSSALNYGGCQVYVSTDGGASFNPVGDPLVGSAIMGALTADWPAAADPDTTNDLAIDLTESNGTLDSYAVSDEDNFVYPCYVEGQQLTAQMNGVTIATPDYEGVMGGVVIWGAVGYELMTYATATLTAANKYALKATGTGNKLRRAVFHAPAVGQGCDHPSGQRWAFLSPAGTGILKLPMDSVWVGKTLQFKICSFNSFGAAAQSPADVSAYSYVPSGIPATVT